MAVFCPKCEKITYDEYTCDHCKFEIKKKPENFKSNSRLKTSSNRIKTSNYKETNYTEKERNPLMYVTAGALTIIAIVAIYFGYQKYKENQEKDKWMQMVFGTTDVDKIEEKSKENMEKINKDMDKILKDSTDKQIEAFKKMFPKP